MKETCRGLPWPCCTSCTPRCTAGCGDRATKVSQSGEVVGAFCSPCYYELVRGKVRPPSGRPAGYRSPRGTSVYDLRGDK